MDGVKIAEDFIYLKVKELSEFYKMGVRFKFPIGINVCTAYQFTFEEALKAGKNLINQKVVTEEILRKFIIFHRPTEDEVKSGSCYDTKFDAKPKRKQIKAPEAVSGI